MIRTRPCRVPSYISTSMASNSDSSVLSKQAKSDGLLASPSTPEPAGESELIGTLAVDAGQRPRRAKRGQDRGRGRARRFFFIERKNSRSLVGLSWLYLREHSRQDPPPN